MYRIIGADQREYGPVSADQIRQWFKEGRANGSTLVQAEGVPGWRPLATYPEFSVPPQAPPAAPSAPPAYAPTPTVAPTAPTNGNAITGLVFGILSVTCMCAGLPVGAIGIIFSCIALSQLGHNPSQKGKGLAIAGLILSIIGVLIGLGYGVFALFPHHGMRHIQRFNF
ncbi:MAG: hypothetical protein JWO95_3626 [Verrucomicrobiales bacterium]|nr:hypothetical protein [Verrucomicrobiales bacterium]